MPKAEAEPVVEFLLLLAGSQASEAVWAWMRQGLAGVVALVEDVELVSGALMGRVVRQDFHKALSLKGLRELCKYLILNRLRPHNKTEEEKNQEKKKKNPRREGSLEAKARPQVSFLCMKNALSSRNWYYA